VVALGLAVGTVLITWQRNEALANLTEAKAQRQRAEGNFYRALDVVNEMVTPFDREALHNNPQVQELRQNLLQQALKYYQSFLVEDSTEPATRRETAAAYIYSSGMYNRLKEFTKAEEAFARAMALYAQLTVDLPNDHFHWQELGQTQNLRGISLHKLGRTQEAADEFRRARESYRHAVQVSPEDSRALNYLAWFLTVCPQETFRDPSQAVQLARKAIALSPNRPSLWNTLGAALYRAGDWQAAETALHKAMQLRQGGDFYDWYFLAMVYWRQGNKQEALRWYGKANEWMEKNGARDDIMQDEAAAVLRSEDPPSAKPD
jgi:tetratricopeptide (TPR) repeat protein